MPFDQGHALVIGVGSYPNAPQLSVPLTAADAVQVAHVLKLPEACAYPPEQVTLLTNETASRERILAELKRLARQTTAESTVLIFYSGHGLYSAAAQYHLTTNDSRLDANGFVVAETAIAQRELLKLIKRLPATRVLLIFNACHSGSINPAVLSIDTTDTTTGSSGANVSAELSAALLATGTGRVIITACKDEQKSYFDPQKPLTVFADMLTRVLQGEDILTNKNVITVFQLYDALYEKVEQAVQAIWKLEQQPELTVSKGVGAMAVAFYQPPRRAVVLGIDQEHTETQIPVRDDQIRNQAAIRVVDSAESSQALARLMVPRRTRKGGNR